MSEAISPEIKALLEAKDKQIAELERLVQMLTVRVQELERRLGLNSQNSSKPPSGDGLKKPPKPPSLREKSGKASGGQRGHKGDTLKQVAQPDEIVTHEIKTCPHCATDLTQQVVTDVRRRQVFDIPEPKILVTEHQAQIKNCPCCAAKVIAAFPPEVMAPVQYGARVRGLSVYLHEQQLIPEDRLVVLFQDVFDLSVSAATLVNYSATFAQTITPLTGKIEQTLQSATVKNLDESGLRVAAKLHWMHVMSNDQWTHYRISPKRGDLPQGLSGHVVHDHFKPYYTLAGVTHALCGAHHLRELKGIAEIEKEAWAKQMARLLKLACHCVNHKRMPATRVARITRCYDTIVAQGLTFHEQQPPLTSGRRGRKKRRPGHNLLIRLRDYKHDALRFLINSDVPFTNNQAEQDIRMIKVKQKISGGFRTLSGAEIFASVRSFLSTMRKQRVNLFRAILNPYAHCAWAV